MLHILSVNDFTDDFLYSLWSDASKRKGKSNSSLKGKILTNLFYEPSTRTSSSFYSAMSSCGGSVIPINNVQFSSVAKGESFEDTIKTMSQMSDAIVVRHPDSGAADAAAKVSSVPIISPLGLGKDNQTFNINGDTAAGAIAKSLKCRRLLLMTNVEGVLDKEKKLIEEITSSEILEMINNEIITEGMIPKINTCLDAIMNGVTGVGIIDGRKKHSILFELFSDKGAGTLIRK